MAEGLELSGQAFKTTVINILSTLMYKGGSMQEQMDNICTNLKYQKEIVEIKFKYHEESLGWSHQSTGHFKAKK
jgi:hypothetical protein